MKEPKGKWRVIAGHTALICEFNGTSVIVHLEFNSGFFYGIVPDSGDVINGGYGHGWSLKKAKRKALKHFFRLKPTVTRVTSGRLEGEF